MSSLDRTKEFFSIVHLEKNQFVNPLDDVILDDQIEESETEEKTVSKSSFFRRTMNINHELFRTGENLEKLSELMDKRTPFDDSSNEIKKYQLKINKQLKRMDLEIQHLEEEVDEKIAKSGNRLEGVSHASRHLKEILSVLQSGLFYATKSFRRLLKQEKKSIKKLRKRRKELFKESRTYFDSTQGVIAPARNFDNLLITESPKNLLSSKVRKERGTLDLVTQEELEREKERDNLEMNPDTNIFIRSKAQELATQQFNFNRTDEVEKIAKEIGSLSTMFGRLADMIVKQKELAQRIDEDVTNASAHVEGAQNELTKYHNTVSSNRGLILKIFIVLILFVLFVGFVIIK